MKPAALPPHLAPRPASSPAPSSLPGGITLLERGWLSSNNVLLHDPSEPGSAAVLVDTGHVVHATQTLALVRHALAQAAGGGAVLRGIVNTHLHSDHCGGNATLQRAFGCSLHIPPGSWAAVNAWDEDALSYAPTGQRCERFVPSGCLRPGDTLRAGRQAWQALAAPGHDPHSLILFNDDSGVVITADALWERGFGIVFPELDGDTAFDEVAATLDLIESLGAAVAIPGHGPAFTDIAGALVQARQRLAAFRADPARHARHALKALLKYHVLEVGRQGLPELLAWFGQAPLYGRVWAGLGAPGGSLQAYGSTLVHELCAAGVLGLEEGAVFNP
ncbi:MBL fold metallo-hydrolase [beta proteobacterium AAP51]|nr:MBL fold metallo-hydrolase [beta proteobacterium AAP51]